MITNSHYEVNLNKKDEPIIPSCIKCKNLHIGSGILGTVVVIASLFIYTDIELIIDWFSISLALQQIVLFGFTGFIVYLAYRCFNSYCNFTYSDGTRDGIMLVYALLATFLVFVLINGMIYFEPIFFDELEIIRANPEDRKSMILDLDCTSFEYGYRHGYYEISVNDPEGDTFVIDGKSIDEKHLECNKDE